MSIRGRLLLAVSLLSFAFALAAAWSIHALRASTRDAELLRGTHVPLLLQIGEVLAEQNVFNAQLNHITMPGQARDVEQWIQTSRRVRPVVYAQLSTNIQRVPEPLSTQLHEDMKQIQEAFREEPPLFDGLFASLRDGDDAGRDRFHAEIIRREAETAGRLRSLKVRVETEMERLNRVAESRGERSLKVLVALSAAAVVSAALMLWYVRYLLAPLMRVTARARTVASGDLTPHDVPPSSGEVGDLAQTFEMMVLSLKKAQADVIHAERLMTIGKMAAQVTHEIRNPLSAMGLNLELLEEELAETSVHARDLVRAVRGEADRLSNLAEQYLGLARRPTAPSRTEPIGELLSSVRAFVEREMTAAGIQLHVSCAALPSPVLVDEGMMRRAILNLLRNAREAMPNGGNLYLELRPVEGGAEVLVIDSGAGISDLIRAQIFEPFFSTKSQGTGLGLAMTQEIVHAHGGALSCEPSPRGTGACFRMTLPRAS